MNTEHPQRLQDWEYEQRSKDAALDQLLFLISAASIMIIFFICVDLLAALFYYFQDGIEVDYLSYFFGKHHTPSSRMRYIIVTAITRWHVIFLMGPAAFHLLEYYPEDYTDWLKQKENSNVLFKKLAWTLVLVMSFVFQLTKAPPGYTDTKILWIYRAVSIGLITLTVLLNNLLAYLINRKKCFNYCGVSNRFSKIVFYAFAFIVVICSVIVFAVLPVITGVESIEATIFAIVGTLVIMFICLVVWPWIGGGR